MNCKGVFNSAGKLVKREYFINQANSLVPYCRAIRYNKRVGKNQVFNSKESDHANL